ncbi:MAG: CdaR family protein [Desulfotomaculaceae bacterium]|nr:CdaR family protein [Desulfotomaculaceae bacterium]MDD4766997.1 CdaR family protein [Desulfotomaculaceae bacterium]
MARFNWRNNSLMLLSLLLAFVLWLYVSNEQNPLRERVLTIELEQTGLEQGYIILGGMPESVTVKVQGNRSQLSNLVPADFKAVLNIPAGKAGDLTLPVQVSTPTGLRINQVTPDTVSLTIDSITEKEVAVAVSLRGAPGQGFTALAPFYQPNTVVASGPSTVIDGIKQATALIDIQGAVADVEQDLQVGVGDSQVSLNPDTVKVIVPIVEMVPVKTVPVIIQVTGNPAAGHKVKSSVADPVSVQLSGQPEALNTISSIQTELVDITGADQNLTREVALAVPQGLGVQPERVQVQVEVVKEEEPPATPPDDSEDTEPEN